MPRIVFNSLKLQSIKPPAPKPDGGVATVDYFDQALPCFGLRVSSTDTRAWFLLKRLDGRVRRFTIGRAPRIKDGPGLTLAQARAEAARMAAQVEAGKDPKAIAEAALAAAAPPAPVAKANGDTFRALVTAYVEGYAKREQRRWADTQRILNKYAVPAWSDRSIYSITRRDVAERLDEIQAGSGTVTANQVLATVRAMFNWRALRDDTFTVPIVPGMARGKITRRERVLSDAEIKAIVPQLGTDTFSAIVRVLFLTLQRRDEVGRMRWADIDFDACLWTIPQDSYKTGLIQKVPLTPEAVAIIQAQPRFDRCPLVFTVSGRTHFQGFSKKKADLDIASGVTGWVLHDIRRTGRTLLARAGVSRDIAERVLGHVLPGIERTYNLYDYLPEKRAALEVLASELEKISVA
jgi:integrase